MISQLPCAPPSRRTAGELWKESVPILSGVSVCGSLPVWSLPVQFAWSSLSGFVMALPDYHAKQHRHIKIQPLPGFHFRGPGWTFLDSPNQHPLTLCFGLRIAERIEGTLPQVLPKTTNPVALLRLCHAAGLETIRSLEGCWATLVESGPTAPQKPQISRNIFDDESLKRFS